LAANHTKRVAARRDKRQLITVAPRRRDRSDWDESPRERLFRNWSCRLYLNRPSQIRSSSSPLTMH
jgi:hypothetical protein